MDRQGNDSKQQRVPAPRPAPAAGPRASSLTFFLTRRQREQVLETLRPHGAPRATALLRALQIRAGQTNPTRRKCR